MSSDRDVVFTGAVRTAVGSFGGSLAGVPPTELGARVIGEAIGRSGIEPGDVGHVVFGQVIHTEPRDMYLARVAAMGAAIGVGLIGMAASAAVGRNPGGATKILVQSILAIAFAEAIVFYALFLVKQ